MFGLGDIFGGNGGSVGSTTLDTYVTGAITATNTITGLGIAQQGLVGAVYTQTFLRQPTMDDIHNHAAFKASLTELSDLWRIRYGNDWVNIDKVVNDDFYSMAAQRLMRTNRLESHTISSPRYTTVYKLND
jgi:3-oxoacyl-ACP reductase-like protein